MSALRIMIVVTTAAALAWCGSAVAQAQAAEENGAMKDEHTIRVTGEGEIEMTPDLGIVTLSVQTEAPTAADAQRQAAERLDKVVQALRGLNIAENKIRTTGLSIYPVYPPRPKEGNPAEPLKPVGYRASNSLRVEAPDPERIGPVVDRALEAGANQVSDISFGVRDEDTPRLNALARAAANAQEKAGAIADALGLKLGPALSVTEGSVSRPPAPVYRGIAAAEGAATPIMPGSLTITATVTVEFALSAK
jgi:uncharacterized protein YggE